MSTPVFRETLLVWVRRFIALPFVWLGMLSGYVTAHVLDDNDTWWDWLTGETEEHDGTP